MLGATRRVLAKALEIDCDLYHLHDPELLPAGLRLKRHGNRVIFDAHEDLPRQILSKPYLHPALRKGVSLAANAIERFACRRLNIVVAATPTIRKKFQRLGIDAIDINNFPLLGELDTDIGWEQKTSEVCYVGGIGAIRGIKEVVSAMALCRSAARLNLAGGFPEKQVKVEVEAMPGWVRVNELGFLTREQVRETLGRSVAGIVTFLPFPNHIDAQPNKMFEYMSAGLPVIASHFPLWREIIEGNNCGICVDPRDPAAIASAIDRLVENPDLAQDMGTNGRRAVHERYNWAAEEKKLVTLYQRLYQI
jgi:glycosyltransferase involved in cell wall biosynthesis